MYMGTRINDYMLLVKRISKYKFSNTWGQIQNYARKSFADSGLRYKIDLFKVEVQLKHTVAFCLVLFVTLTSARAEPASLRNGMVVSEERIATLVGLSVLRKGGNAVDAAVAVGFALAVTHPRAGNLGGGGFMLVHLGKTGRTIAIDYREKAPLKATHDMFLDKNGEVDMDRVRHSVYSCGVPGTVAGLSLALEKYGTMPLEKVLAPAIRLAEEGFAVTPELRKSLLGAKGHEEIKREHGGFFQKQRRAAP